MSTPTPIPDIEGFADAQAKLTTQFGRDVRFYQPAQMLYDPGISPFAFDDEGIPLDPLAGASAVASANVGMVGLSLRGSAQANVVFKPLQTSVMRRDETFESPVAIRSGLNKDLLVNLEDIPIASGATHFLIGTFARDADGNILYLPDGSEQEFTVDDGELWKIVNAKTDGLGSFQRYVVYGQGTR
jgi:hypothetical protein